MLGSFERLRVGNAATLTEKTLLSGHRLQPTYVLGPFSERFSKKRGHARLYAKILHNLLSLRSRSLGPSVNGCTLAGSIPSLLVAEACNCQLHIRRSCAPILTGSRSELSDTLGCAATGHAQLSKQWRIESGMNRVRAAYMC